jgi:hypothetical protein
VLVFYSTISGAVPVNAFDRRTHIIALLKISYACTLFVNCSTFVSALQFLKVPEKFDALYILVKQCQMVLMLVRCMQKSKMQMLLPFGTLLNNPVGTLCQC